MNDTLNFIILAVAGSFIPAGVWLWFWLKEDAKHPEPQSLIVAVFFLGSLIIVPVYFLEQAVSQITGLSFAEDWLTLILIWAAIEELSKYVIFRTAISHRRQFDEPLDAMVYLITIALGFAAAENGLFMLSTFLGPGGDAAAFWFTGNLRFLGATLIHVVASAVVGYAVAVGFYSPAGDRRLGVLTGLITASLLHSLFNYFIIVTDEQSLIKVFILVWSGAILTLLFFERAKTIIRQPITITIKEP